MTEFLDQLHLPTLIFMLGLVEVLKFGCFTVLWLPRGTEPGLGGWWLGYTFIDLGLIFVFGREALSIPYPIAALLGNCFLIAGFYVTLMGTRDFMERPRARGMDHLTAGLAYAGIIALLVYFIFVSPSFLARVFLLSTVASFMTLLQILALWPMWRDRHHPMGKFLIVCLAVTLVGHVGRMVASLFSDTPMPIDIFEQNAHNVWILVVTVVHSWLLGFGLVAVTAEKVMKRLRLQADRDPLTGLNNRQAFLGGAGSALSRSLAQGRPFTLLVIDPDRLKRLNDGLGQDAGDRALRQIANQLSAETRKGEVVGHVGGGAFALALPDTDVTEARERAEALRALIAHYPVPIRSASTTITASIGAVTLPGSEPGPGAARASAGDLLQSAEAALIQAKERGRNTVHQVTHGPTLAPIEGDSLPLTAS